MERKIGEIFEYNGEWYQCLPERICDDCAFKNNITCKNSKGIRGECQRASRQKDGVIFKKLEKYGGFIKDNIRGEIRQPYTIFDIDRANSRDDRVQFSENKDNFVFVVTKQTKEDMEEKNLNLKPFDIQKAREGKPVCTRDGRKARIICYDRQSDHGFPIVALVENTGAEKDEDVHFYRANGTAATAERAQDLMMLSEKKVGWVNLYKSGNSNFAAILGSVYVYNTKEGAINNANPDKTIATLKIEWEG